MPARHALTTQRRAGGGDEGILSVSIVMGFHLADVADVGVQMLVIADDDEQAAARVASALGEELWGLRESAAPTYLSPDEAIAEAGNVRPPLIGLSPSRRTDRRGTRMLAGAIRASRDS